MMWKLVFVIIAAVSFIGLAQIPGGFTDISINDEGAKEALDFAVLIHNRHSNDFYIRVVTDVIKVQVQVSKVSLHKYTQVITKDMKADLKSTINYVND